MFTPVEVEGVVVNSAGQPVAGAMVELHAWAGPVLGSTVSGSDGRFEFSANSQQPMEVYAFVNGSLTTAPVSNVSALNTVTVRVDAAPAPRSSSATVSLNDLEAPPKAKSKLADAKKAISKLQLGRAWKLVNDAIREAPSWGRAYMFRGVLSMQSQDYAAAQQDFATALAHNPQDTTALTQLGKLYASTGQLPLADATLHHALTLPPVAWPTYFEMANVDMKERHYAEAEQMASAGLAADPPAPPTLHFLAAEAADALHQNAVAMREYQSFLKLTHATAPLQSARQLAAAHLAALATAARAKP